MALFPCPPLKQQQHYLQGYENITQQNRTITRSKLFTGRNSHLSMELTLKSLALDCMRSNFKAGINKSGKMLQ